MSRRDLLRTGGVLGAGLALGACTLSSNKDQSALSASAAQDAPNVVVVGAGLAGLTASYRLSQAGIPVRCFEASDRIGGRCFSSRGWADQQVAEHGGEFIDTRHVHLHNLAGELGLQLDDLWDAWVDGSAWPYYVDGEVTARREWSEAEVPVVDAVTAAARRIGVIGESGISDDPVTYGTATAEGREMDQMSMSEWLDAEVPGVTGSSLGLVLDELMAGWYGLGMAGLSAALWFDYYLIPAKGADERYTVHGGNDQVPMLLSERLPEGSVVLESPLEALRGAPDGSYELRFAGSSQPVTADIVVLALPYTALHDVDLEDSGFSEERISAIQTQSMGQNTKLLLQLDAHPDSWSVGDRVWSGGMEHADAIFETWESSGTEGGSSTLITVFSGGAGASSFAATTPHAEAQSAIVDETLAAIDQVVPGVSGSYNGRAWLDFWPADPWTKGSYAAFGPGQMSTLWGYNLLPEGGVHFAGEHTSTYSQGYLNGGVESGQRAAIEVMNRVGVPIPDEIASLPYSS